MRVTYIGVGSGTSRHRADALRRLGHDVTVIDPRSWLGNSKWVSRWLHHLGGFGVSLRIDSRLLRETRASSPNAIIVNQGEFLGRSIIHELSRIAPIANYINDDPFGGRDGRRFIRYLRSISEYDVICVVRPQNAIEAHELGARHVIRVHMSADELAHFPRLLDEKTRAEFASEVLFIGTWMPERGPFLVGLAELGVPISIWGDRWQRAPEWESLQSYWRGPGLYNEDDYAAAIQSAKVSIGLLSIGNRDEHTTRSMEIPLLGGMLCAERTSEHVALYKEGEEAEFWSTIEECAAKCFELLRDPEKRAEIAARGQKRAQSNGHLNEQVMAQILAALQDAQKGTAAVRLSPQTS